ncbi:MAG TPA: GNAT family N-acetyltransferase [Pseudonocardiaceae bacterium]|nr:GNAT family N-acetyltransferase [Pseudonocardiaceae bacterium]
MNITRLHDVHEFWRQVAPLYTVDPVRHTIALTVLRRVREGHGFSDQAPVMMTIEDDGKLVGSVFCTPPFPLGLSAMPIEAARPVAEFALAEGLRPSSALGEHEVVDAFAAAWHELTGATSSVDTDERLYRLSETEFTPPTNVPGELVMAGEDDFDVLVRFRREFAIETQHRPELDNAERGVRALFASGGGQGLWWVDGRPVSLAAASKPIEGMSRIAPVYTPQAERGHGYGSAVTAGVSQWAIDQGASDVVLFTDLANPISNSIYQRIGYRPVMDIVEVAFAESAS